MSKTASKPQYVICIFNEQNPLSLQTRRLYRVVDPEPGDPDGYIRIIDDEGEDYIYPRDWFIGASLPDEVLAAVESV